MGILFVYLVEYWKDLNKKHFFFALVFISLLIFCNYYFLVNDHIQRLAKWQQYAAWYLIFATAFIGGYAIVLKKPYNLFDNRHFLFLLFFAPLVFSWKTTASIHFVSLENAMEARYWNLVIYYPFKVLVVTAVIYVLWKLLDADRPFYGFRSATFEMRPYLVMLMFMVPLIALASTQADFLATYPKLKSVSYLRQGGHYLEKILYELSYGSDFLTIEIFFRGFLVLAFVRFVGRHAIIPMALFYCTIHFGKPLGECISSFFGGMILGVITYKTRSIWGGLIVHLGIAWLMELGGYLGSKWFM